MGDLSLDPVSLSDMTLDEGPLSGAEEPESLGASAASAVPVSSTASGAVAGVGAVCAGGSGAGGGGGVGGGGGGGGGVIGGVESSISATDSTGGNVSDSGTEVPCIPALNTARLIARMK